MIFTHTKHILSTHKRHGGVARDSAAIDRCSGRTSDGHEGEVAGQIEKGKDALDVDGLALDVRLLVRHAHVLRALRNTGDEDG